MADYRAADTGGIHHQISSGTDTVGIPSAVGPRTVEIINRGNGADGTTPLWVRADGETADDAADGCTPVFVNGFVEITVPSGMAVSIYGTTGYRWSLEIVG